MDPYLKVAAITGVPGALMMIARLAREAWKPNDEISTAWMVVLYGGACLVATAIVATFLFYQQDF